MKLFQRKKEDFICENCGEKIVGNGYTDHCPYCLWGKHVDINPGDRLADCKGAMQPIGVEVKQDRYVIFYKCIKCGHFFRVKAADNDDVDVVIRLSGKGC